MTKEQPGNSHWRGRLSTVDLLVLTRLDQLLLKLPTTFTFLTKQATLMRRSSVLSLQLVFPGTSFNLCMFITISMYSTYRGHHWNSNQKSSSFWWTFFYKIGWLFWAPSTIKVSISFIIRGNDNIRKKIQQRPRSLPGNPYWKRSFSTFDLRQLTPLDQLISL